MAMNKYKSNRSGRSERDRWRRGRGGSCMCGEIRAAGAYVRTGRLGVGDWLSNSEFMQSRLESPCLPPGTPLYLFPSLLLPLSFPLPCSLLMASMWAGGGQSLHQLLPCSVTQGTETEEIWKAGARANAISLWSKNSNHFILIVFPAPLPATHPYIWVMLQWASM